MPIPFTETDPFQFCPECDGGRDECWRCGGRGTVEPDRPLEPRYAVRVYVNPADGRSRCKLLELEPEVPT